MEEIFLVTFFSSQSWKTQYSTSIRGVWTWRRRNCFSLVGWTHIGNEFFMKYVYYLPWSSSHEWGIQWAIIRYCYVDEEGDFRELFIVFLAESDFIAFRDLIERFFLFILLLICLFCFDDLCGFLFVWSGIF